MNIINLFKNNIKRILKQKAIIIIAVIVVPIMICVAILFSTKAEMKTNIALVTNKVQNIPKNSKIEIDVMRKSPAEYNLLLGKYAAIVKQKDNGNYKVITLKNKEDKRKIEAFFKTGKVTYNKEEEKSKRGVGTSILGFIMMIVLTQGVALTLTFPEDRDLKTFRRVLTAPVSEREYLIAQGLATFICVYVPTYAAVIITKLCFGVKIGFTIGGLGLLIGILSAISTAAALLISSILQKEISVFASGVYALTSIMAGCFYSFKVNNKMFNYICNVIPQKEFMTLSQGIENGSSILKFKAELGYLLLCTILFWLLGSIITKRKLKSGVY
ncbi:ABC-2 type transport system permease protein [Clostridium acetobutylicum]|uniref:Predicted membrane protein n=1 Tax=Clostridium acetobutylicum (strain ATCC 824 / DSM 792 / JCM 1419 / IAM 19013 / LMG 5710 / NBRC 13948 / NRRL B-527 / VKM B-1787 / 2291 / W) TaxID=272562 RepID=Q97DR9_CLOAB|nr:MULTISPECIES: ABC transporter permease [Clostridium]AAK81333.1 Predicted membrane protein [Clostridium acetobutylicum ATCC 824]ADZ22443.1 membrane protein [Clostridium acetobutylicum EA 2018]AEI32823.1 hypothetical protein SMB_G3440 [Clostridium acetobutylicum DSM 1731]AWV81000.1 ABC transporter permease [Clostridium acetobutylicum]MBC2395513.1 ABC transporter permease [Clostridium acetobutylicum]